MVLIKVFDSEINFQLPTFVTPWLVTYLDFRIRRAVKKEVIIVLISQYGEDHLREYTYKC